MPGSMHLFATAVLMLSLMLTSCSGVRLPESSPILTTQTPEIKSQSLTASPLTQSVDPPPVDPCSSLETKKPDVENIARIMGEFDDTSFLIQSIPDAGQMVQVILVLQRIRRDAINNKPPECLNVLKDAQVSFMSGVVLTSISIMSKAKNDVIQGQLTETRILRSAYDQELANQLGLKYITATPAPTIPPTPIPVTSTVSPVTARTDQDIYVVQGAGLTFPAVGTFLRGQIANVIGRNEKNDWIQIDVPSNPGNAGWVPRQLIKLSGPAGSIPIVAEPPTPQPTAAQ